MNCRRSARLCRPKAKACKELGGLESGQAEHRRPGQRRDEHIDHESVQVEERHHIESEGGAVESEGRADAERADPH
jgi:hypothetical protein